MKKLSAKVGEYTDSQGNIKGKYVNLGVIMSNQNGHYALLDPTVSLSGVLASQNAYASKQGKPYSDRIMVGIYEDQQQGQRQQPQQPQQRQQAPQQQAPAQDFEQDIPF